MGWMRGGGKKDKGWLWSFHPGHQYGWWCHWPNWGRKKNKLNGLLQAELYSLQIHIKILTPPPPRQYLKCILVWRWVFDEKAKLKWGHDGGPYSIMTGVLVRREDYGTDASEERSWKDTGRRWPSIDQVERPQETPTLWTPWSQTSGLQHCEKINVN